ncbi:MAG: GxxExxY protein [Acidobacteriota bacterium]
MSSDDHRSLTETILGAVFEVSNTLGPGFLERVYARALALELRIRGLSVASEVSYDVVYKSELIGQYYADLVVNDTVVVELKCTDHLSNDHLAQCLNYLKASASPFASSSTSNALKSNGSELY